MADESKGIPSWAWLALAAVVVFFLYKKFSAGPSLGSSIGKGAVDEALHKASSSGAISGLGSFIGGLFSGSSGKSGGAGPGGTSAAFTSDTSPAIYTPGESFDDYSTGLFGPGINPDGTGAET